MPECEVCKVDLDLDDDAYTWADEEVVEVKNKGHCPKCGKKYKWRDIYKYSHFDDLREA